jgi:hypothetical protein
MTSLVRDGGLMSYGPDLKESVERAADLVAAHRHNDLVQGQIRLLGYQSQQPFHVLLQRRRVELVKPNFGK